MSGMNDELNEERVQRLASFLHSGLRVAAAERPPSANPGWQWCRPDENISECLFL